VFQGPPLQPQVRLSASYDIPSRDNPGGSEVVIRLDVEGRPDSLRLILSSTPSMDNADIVSYIATGRPAAQSLSGSGGTPTVSEVGVELAAGRLTSAVEGLAADAIGLDVVEIRREGPRDAVFVAGRYVSPRLYIGFQQPVSFGSEGGSVQQSLGQRVEIEYEAFRWLLLNLEGGRSDVEFFFRTRYGY
ncbi:MAG: translocation/assembly module TamB, partial [Gemmatimonadota bacterium]|nr:translocation/assembly module TamB [Gemmatimonadota bacterium]